jgi:competence protein ComEC
MPAIVLCVLSGAYSLEILHQLPAQALLWPATVLSAACLALTKLRLVGACLSGFTFMWFAAQSHIDDRLDPTWQRQALTIDAYIVDFPTRSTDTLRFIAAPIGRPELPERVRLTWFQPDVRPQAGQLWQLQVKLRRPHGYANPDGFDYEGWLFRKGIGATGYVLEEGANHRVQEAEVDVIGQIRGHFVARVTRRFPDDDAAAVLMAIGVGARHKITRAQWDRYAATGTSHLMAISGLHIGLAAGSMFLFSWLLLAPFCNRRNVRDLAALVAIITAGAYALVSGMAVPAQRAFLMALVVAVALGMRRRLSGAAMLAVPGLLIFLLDPIAILTPGFKLSFSAVGILYVYARQHFRPTRFRACQYAGAFATHARRLIYLQFALLAGLLPLTVLEFSRVAIAAPLVNLLALPIFNFVTVPLCLFGMLFDGPLQGVGDTFLGWAYESIRIVLMLVDIVAEHPGLRFDIPALGGFFVVVAAMPLLHVILPPAWPGRRLAWIAIVAVLLYKPSPPPSGCMDFSVLDVGQGLAVVLRTREHVLLFDTGPSFRSGSNTAELVVMPYLQSVGIGKLDKLVVSHADQDHAGGFAMLLQALEIEQVVVGEQVGQSQPPPQHQCIAGYRWRWDEIGFEILHPRNSSAWTGNNRSCVVLVSVGNTRLLLTGDIEAPVETLLVHTAALPRADIVIVPHHGSGTSSSQTFIKTLEPALAVVSAGFANRWGMPAKAVVRRWEQAGAQVLNTATAGAISQRLCRSADPGPVRRSRIDSMKYWHDKGPLAQ